MALTDLHRRFRDEDQRRRAAALVRIRLGDDRNQEECHSLLRFVSQLSTDVAHIDEAELAAAVSRDKLAAVHALIIAARSSYEAIDAWIDATSQPSPLFAAKPRLEMPPSAPGPDDVDLAHLQAAVDAGVDGAAFRLAELLESKGESSRAAAAYRLAAEAGDAQALYALGRVYLAQDQREAAAKAGDRIHLPDWRITEVWQHAADLGLVEAMYAVAMMAGLGTGMALRYLRQAAALNHPPACYALGYDASRRGDHDEAITWWTKAADSGHQPARDALALLTDRP